MNRRKAFKLFAASAVSLLGMKGLAETLRGPEMVQGISDVQPLGPVMGEQAHWPDGATLLDLRFDRGREDFYLPHNYRDLRGKVDRFKIDGEWVDTSDWSPEQIRQRLQPRPLKRRHV